MACADISPRLPHWRITPDPFTFPPADDRIKSIPRPPLSDPAMTADAEPVGWTPLTRLAFRFVFCYCLLYVFCCGNVTLWKLIPFAGETLEAWLAKPFWRPAQWLGQHLFHLQGVSAVFHQSGSGDKPLDWIAFGLMLIVAVVTTLVWTVLDRDRTEYRTLFRWFSFVLRLAIG